MGQSLSPCPLRPSLPVTDHHTTGSVRPAVQRDWKSGVRNASDGPSVPFLGAFSSSPRPLWAPTGPGHLLLHVTGVV